MTTRRRSRGRGLRLYGNLRALNPHYVDFLRAYIAHWQETHVWNGAAAARAVGYSTEHANGEAHRILSMPEVHEAWRAYLERENIAGDIEPTAASIEYRQNLHAIATFQLADVVEYDGSQVVIRPTEEWSPQARRAVKTIRQKETVRVDKDGATETTRTIEIEAHDKNAALRLALYKGGTTMRLPGGQEIESEGGILVYQVNRFEIPDNGRGPIPLGALQEPDKAEAS